MFRVFVAQNRGGTLFIEISQNILFEIKKLNRILEKKKKKDRWHLVWFSDSFERIDAQKVLAKLKRINSLAAMQSIMKEASQHKEDAESSDLKSNVVEFQK